MGLMVGMEFVEPGGTAPHPRAATMMLEQTKARGLLVGKGGLYGDALRLAPPMSVTAGAVAEALDILAAAVATVERELAATDG